MSVIAWFSDFVGFAKTWAIAPHSDVHNLFYDRPTYKVPL